MNAIRGNLCRGYAIYERLCLAYLWELPEYDDRDIVYGPGIELGPGCKIESEVERTSSNFMA